MISLKKESFGIEGEFLKAAEVNAQHPRPHRLNLRAKDLELALKSIINNKKLRKNVNAMPRYGKNYWLKEIQKCLNN